MTLATLSRLVRIPVKHPCYKPLSRDLRRLYAHLVGRPPDEIKTPLRAADALVALHSLAIGIDLAGCFKRDFDIEVEPRFGMALDDPFAVVILTGGVGFEAATEATKRMGKREHT